MDDKKRKTKSVSEAFQFVTIQSKCYRPVNQIDGYHQGVVTRDANKNSFQALERAISDSHTLTYGKVRVRAAFGLRSYQRANSVNLLFGNGRCLFARTDKCDYAIGLKDANSRLHGPSGAGKDIAGEQRKFDDFSAVTPGPDLGTYGEECFNTRGFQRVFYNFFVTWARLERVPLSDQ
jgi:hypothetical protein